MKKWVRFTAISAVTFGILAFGYQYQGQTRVSAAEQFYSVPDTNTNIQQENSTSNAMASYNDNSIQNVASTPPKVTVPQKYTRTKLNMDVQNPANSYTSQDGSNTLSTYYYLPEGFHVKNTEHGNYQSSVQVGKNIYIVESMGTGTNQGAIVRYNTDDLKQLGVLTDDGSGRDLVWKALKYISPYTKTGNNHSSQYSSYQSFLDDANSNLKSTQDQVQNAQDQVTSDQQEADEYQKTLDKTTKQVNTYIGKVQKQINAQYKIDKKTDKNIVKPIKLNADNFVDYFKSVNVPFNKRVNKITKQQTQVKQQISDLKDEYKGKTAKKAADDAAASAASSAVDSNVAADSSAASAQSSTASSAISTASSTTSANDRTTDSANSVATDTDKKTKAKKMTKQEYTKRLVPLQKKLAKLNQSKAVAIQKMVPANNYIKEYSNGLGKQLATDKQNVDDANELVSQDQDAVDEANDAVVNSQKAIDNLKNNQVDYAKYSAIAHAAQISPLINIGHGQTLSYNPQTNNLYLAQDDSGGDLAMDANNVITELDANTLQPIKQFNFQLLHNNKNLGIHTLTFDNNGNAYFGRKAGSKYQIFQGQFNESTGQVNFAPVPQTINWGGKHNQGLTYNPVNNKLYIVSDDIITSVPVDKLNNGTVDPSDVHYLSFNTGREFEDLTFDAQGYGYLLALWQPEILKSSNPMN